MDDIFERDQQHNIFSLPETPGNYKVDVPKLNLPENPQELPTSKAKNYEEAMRAINEKIDKQLGFQENMRSDPGANLTLREYASIYDMVDKGLIEDDDIFKMLSSKNLSEYLSEHLDIDLPATTVFDFYDELFSAISNDRQDRFSTAKSRYEAVQNSIQIAKNNTPLSKMGNDLRSLNEQLLAAGPQEKEALQKQVDDLWQEITAIRNVNEDLGKRFPKDALTTIMTSTIQSAPMTGKSVAAGIGGGLVAGTIGAIGGAAAGGVGAAPGFAGGFKLGYGLGSFAASSTEMAGLMYIDLIAAGMEQKNAAKLSMLGGGINGIIESSLGVVAGAGASAAKAVGGKVISAEVQKKIAENASKNFIAKVSNTIATSPIGKNAIIKSAFDTAAQAAGEGLEEGLQYLTEQAMLAIGDAMQDSTVDRNLWGSPEFQEELKQSVIGGIAGGIGFGVMGLPLTITGNIQEIARQTEALKNLAVTIDDKAEFRAAAKENPLTKNLTDKEIDQIHDSQETERQSYHSEMRDEAQRAGKNIAAMPTLEAPGEMRRQNDGRLTMRITSPEDESSGNAILYDPPTRQRMGSIDFDWDIDSNTITIENIDLSQAITDREKVIGDMIKELSYKNPEMSIEWNPDAKASEAAGVDLETLKNNLIAENPRGEDWNLQFYQKGDRFTQSRAANQDIDLIASTANVSRDIASDTFEAWDIAFRKFGLDTHEMIGKMGLTSESNLRIVADNNPQGVEAQVLNQLDAGKIAAQKIGEIPAGGTIVLKKNEDGTRRILYKSEAFKEAIDQLQAITVLTEAANPSTLHHEWLHFMVNVVIPNSPRYKALLEDAVGKKLEDFNEQDHEWLADNYERYLKTGEAPTPGLKALFKRIAEALRDFVRNGTVSPKLREFFDAMLAGPESAMLKDENNQAQVADTGIRIETDNEQQKAFAEMTSAERILQSDLHSMEEKAEILYAMKRMAAEDQLKAIYDQYHNQDGTAKAGWLKAPNGKDTNLTERQWMQVRTPAFKNWFGDWEALLKQEEFDALVDEAFDSDKEPKSKMLLRRSTPEEIAEVKRQGGPDITGLEHEITSEHIRHIIKEHGGKNESIKHPDQRPITKDDISLLPAVIDAPTEITVKNIDKNLTSVIYGKDFGKGKICYVERIIETSEKNKPRLTLKTAWVKATTGAEPSTSAVYTPHRNSNILFPNGRVKPDFISKVVDENGEPMTVFRGDKTGLDRFTNQQGIFHASSKKVAEKYSSGGLYDLFLDIKNPYIHTAPEFLKIRRQINDFLYDIYDKDWSELENNEQFQTLRKNYLEFRNEKGSTVRDFYNSFLPEVSENTDLEEFKDILSKSLQDVNQEIVTTSQFEQLDYHELDILNPFIKSLGYDGIKRPYDHLGQAEGNEYITFYPSQIKSATDNIGDFDPQNLSIFFQNVNAYDLVDELENDKTIADINTENFKNWFGESKVVDENGNPQVVYHGTARPDRIGTKFDPKKATSGPMAYFTTDRNVGEGYAKNKEDTSLVYDEPYAGNYENWFRVKSGRGKPVPIAKTWYQLSAEQQKKMQELAPRITQNDEGEIYLKEEGYKKGIGNYEYEIKENRGNVIATLIEGWLNGGTLFGEEESFYEVLKLAGYDIENVSYHDPKKTTPAIFPVYLNISNPLNTSDINKDTLAALEIAAKKAKKRKSEQADDWDKNSIDPSEWLEGVKKDIKINTTYSWTSIPDWVTNTLKNLGYDGIKDKGGKYTEQEHTVWIPFISTQVKSIYNRGTFDPEKTNILFQHTYHGSAAHFTRFDNKYMGAGVGAQAFGYGQYVSKKQSVADGYRKQFADYQVFIDDKQIASSEMYKHIDTYQAASDGTLDEHIKGLEEQLAETPKEKQEPYKKEIKLAKSLKDKNVQMKRGQLYKVEIPDDSELLNWDKELKSQKNILKMIKDQAVKEDIDDILNYGGTGGEFYANELIKWLGSPKEASAFLNRAGVKGNKHWDNRDEAFNFVIFKGSDIDIVQMLFQMTREEIQTEALRHSSPEAWMKADIFAEAFDAEASYRRDNAAEEPQRQAELEAWYKKQWDEAQVLAREAALNDDGTRTPANAEAVNPALLDDEDGSLDWDTDLYDEEIENGQRTERRTENMADESAGDVDTLDRNGGSTEGKNTVVGGYDTGNQSPISTSEANKHLISKLPSVIDDFVLIMGRTLRENLAHFGAITAEDAAVRDQMENDKNRIYKEVHPYIHGLALGMTTGKKLTDKQRRTALSHMRRSLESGATVYRELYTSLTEDPQFVSYANNEVQDEGTHGEAQKAAAEAQGLTAFQRTRLAENIIDKDIARKIRAGKATSEEIADYIKRRDEEIKELDKEIKNAKADLEKSKGETAEEHVEVEAWRQQYYKTRKELQAAKKEAEQLQKKLTQARIARTNAAERAKATRKNSEVKLKEKLAAKREEIKTLRKKIKDDIAHAKKSGKLEVAWKWAEERKKLSKIAADRKRRIADRKAAKKYMEANKKLAAWIMSADRVGMNVWVRQRELILGLQNALFNTSKIAAQARMYEAQIKAAEKNLQKLCKKISKVTDEKIHSNLERQINEQMEYLENLKSSRNSIEIMGPYLAGVETDQSGNDTDTIDTGTIVYNGDTMSVEEFRQKFYESKIRYGFMDAKLRKALRKSAPSAKSIGEKRKWSAVNLAKGLSQEDLLAIKAVMQQLNKEGRANWERREFAIQLHQKDLTKTLLFNLDELEEDDDKEKTAQIKRYIKAMQTSDLTERERLLKKGTEAEQKLFMTFDDKRLVQWMDGNKKGALYRFIIRERLRYANKRDTAIDKRTERIMGIIGKETPEQQEANKNLPELKRKAKIREQALKRIKELGEKNIRIEGVGPRRALRKWQYDSDFKLQEAQSYFEMPTGIDVSLADLMFLVVALDNKFARNHYLYGNLWSVDERVMYEKTKDKDGKFSPRVREQINDIGKEKELALRAAINQHLFEDDGKGGRQAKKELMDIVDAIRDDFESHFPETRAVYEDMFNQAVEGQDNYLPLIITEGKHAQSEKQNEIEALTQGSYQVKINPDKGMMLCRVDIGATNQTEIESDIFKVFFKGVEREEHFNKFAPYVRDINTVLRGLNNSSKQLSGKLTDIYGKWAVDRLYQHVNMIGLPPSAKLGNAWENAAGLGRMLAGNAGVAYIAYNVPAWLAQYPNSIAAFFGQADARFILSGCLEVMKPGNDLVERVFEKSPKVRKRVINVAEEYRQHLEKQPGKLKEVHAKFIEIGMMGQRHADQTMVSIGWWALYQTALKDGKSEEDAIVFADEITAETQPDLNALETSPLYKDQGLGGLFLRFSQPLNMVWQNLTYDSFISREKSFSKTVPRFIAYGLAAFIVAIMRGALADKDGEELDKEELMRKVFYYMVFSQFAESTPLIGNAVAGTLERAITGEGVVYRARYFELAEKILNIPGRIEKENFGGAFNDAFRALGLGIGLPVSQINRIKKAIQEESPWIIFGFDPD